MYGEILTTAAEKCFAGLDGNELYYKKKNPN